MRKETFNIAVACFIGTALGLLIAFKLDEMFAIGRYFWLVGMPVGAGAGYLLYDPVMIWRAAKRAWREADGKRIWQFLRRALRRTTIITEALVLIVVILAGIMFIFLGGFIGSLCLLWKVVCGLARFAWRAPKGAWLFAVFSARLLRRIFILIHSTERIVCFTDTALGVAASYMFVSPTLTGIASGGFIGLVLGVANYEIISVRVLKLAPARAKKQA